MSLFQQAVSDSDIGFYQAEDTGIPTVATGLLYTSRQKHVSVCWQVLIKRLALLIQLYILLCITLVTMAQLLLTGVGMVAAAPMKAVAEGLRSNAKLGALRLLHLQSAQSAHLLTQQRH